MMTIISIENTGKDIKKTNFFDLDVGKTKFYLSLNAGAFRLLIPDKLLPVIQAEYHKFNAGIIITRGPSALGPGEYFDIIFDDLTESPFSIQLDQNSIDRLPGKENEGKEFWFSGWKKGPIKIFETKCLYGWVSSIPTSLEELFTLRQ